VRTGNSATKNITAADNVDLDENRQSTDKNSAKQDTDNEDTADKEQASGDCSRVCLNRVRQHRERWRGDLLNMTDVGRLVHEARNRFEAKLKANYGEENFRNIFYANGTSRGRRVFLPASGQEGGVSIQRFKRKLKLKILGMQEAIQKELDAAGECNCGETVSSHRRLGGDEQLSFASHYERMVWATGGHSAAAGHGNLFNESYTAFLEQAITPVFGSIGIEFTSRNHAMGGTPSAPEIALCQEAVFGTDADIVTYDYGMTDAGYPMKKAMYDERIGLHPNRPAIMDINILAEAESEHLQTIQREEERGLTALYLNPSEFKTMKNAFPDTFGLNASQINAMPSFVRHFKCRDFFEKGDPYCGEKKYDNDEICPDRGMMADWHPGWKMMALWGNTFALFLSDMLIDAIDELKSAANPTDVLNQLKREEDMDYKSFFESTSAKDSTDYDLVPKDSDLVNGANASIFFSENSVCHTARLPAQTRYLGILTESKQNGVHEYFKGISLSEARNMTSDGSAEISMPLVYDESERQSCEVELNRDYQDHFFASSRMGWATMIIPNEAEKRAYVKDSQKFLGVLVLCLVKCPWDECEDGAELRKDAIFSGQLHFQVNGIPVTNATDLIQGCMVLRGQQGHHWQPNADGQYVLRTQVLGNGTDFSFVRVSSLILL